jgi:hypothetical protein
MVRRTLVEGKDPKTQSLEAVKQLIAYHSKDQEPQIFVGIGAEP